MKRKPAAKTARRQNSQSGFAQNQAELAAALGIDRRTLTNARQRFPETAPKPRADGRYDVAAYRTWFDAIGVEGRPKADELVDERDLRKQLLQEKIRGVRQRNDKSARVLVPIAEVELGLARTLNAFQSALRAFPGRVSQKLVGLKDFHEIKTRIEGELEIALRVLLKCDFLDNDAAAE